MLLKISCLYIFYYFVTSVYGGEPELPPANHDCTHKVYNKNIRIRSNFYRDSYVVLRPDLYNFAYVQKMSDLEAVYPENGATFVGQQCFKDAICLRSGLTYFNPEKYLVATDNVQYAPTGHTFWFNKNYFWFYYYDDDYYCPYYENVSYKEVSDFEMDVEDPIYSLNQNYVMVYGYKSSPAKLLGTVRDGSVFAHKIFCSDVNCNSLEDCMIVMKEDFLKIGCMKEIIWALAPNPNAHYGAYVYYYNKEEWPKYDSMHDLYRFRITSLNVTEKETYIDCSICNNDSNQSIPFSWEAEVEIGRSDTTTFSIALEMATSISSPVEGKTDLTWSDEELTTTRKTVTLKVGPIDVPINKEVVIFSRRLEATLPGTDEKFFEFISRRHTISIRDCSKKKCKTEFDSNESNTLMTVLANPG